MKVGYVLHEFEFSFEFEAFTAVMFQVEFFWVMTPCSVVLTEC